MQQSKPPISKKTLRTKEWFAKTPRGHQQMLKISTHQWDWKWWEKQSSVTSPNECQKKIKSTSNTAWTQSNLECSQHCLLLRTNAVSPTVTETLRKKGQPLVDMNQHGWQFQQEPASQTTQNHTSGKPNAVGGAEMTEQPHQTTNFPTMTCSSEEQNSRTQQTDLREETAVIHLQHACAYWMSQEERCQQHRTTTRCPLKQGTSFHTWTLNQSGQPTETRNSECISNQLKPTTEAPKCRQHPHQGLLQSHPFRSPQKNLQPDNNHGNKQKPTTRQNFHTTLPSSTTGRADHQKGCNIDWTCITMKKPKLLNKLREIPTVNATEGEQPAFVLDISTSGPNQSTQSSNPPMTSSTSNGWECQCLATDLPTLEKSFREIHQGNSQSVWPPSQDFEPPPCNCRTGGNGACGHNNMCRNSTAVHEVKCNNTGKPCMGNTPKVQSQNATTLQWSPKACQAQWEIGLMRQTLCNSIPWHKSIPNQPTWGNNLQHHLARQPHECSQNIWHQKMCPVCQRENCNSQTIKIQPTTSYQLWQQVCSACGHRSCFHRCAKQTPPSLLSQSMKKEPAQHTKSPHVLLDAMFA